MKKLLGILVLSLLWCNVAQSYDLAKSYIKQNLERFNELRFSKFGEKCDPAKDKKGDCRVSRSIAKIAERCIGKESWDTWFTSDVERTKKEREEIINSQCRNVHQYMVRQFAKVEKCKVIAFSRTQNHLDVAKRLGATDTMIFSKQQEEFLNSLKEKHGLLDAAIVFAPADIVTDTAIKSVKKGGIIVIATVGKNPEFSAFEEKTIRGTLIGSTKDMEQVIKICDENKIEVIYQTFPLENANEALKKLKDSQIEARAVLIP